MSVTSELNGLKRDLSGFRSAKVWRGAGAKRDACREFTRKQAFPRVHKLPNRSLQSVDIHIYLYYADAPSEL